MLDQSSSFRPRALFQMRFQSLSIIALLIQSYTGLPMPGVDPSDHRNRVHPGLVRHERTVTSASTLTAPISHEHNSIDEAQNWPNIQQQALMTEDQESSNGSYLESETDSDNDWEPVPEALQTPHRPIDPTSVKSIISRLEQHQRTALRVPPQSHSPCAACLENLRAPALVPYQTGQKYPEMTDRVVKLDCEHWYHGYCISEWIEQRGHDASCAQCRYLISSRPGLEGQVELDE